MAEGLALNASIIAIIQISNTVLSICYDYSAALHRSLGALGVLQDDVKALRDVLQTLEPLAKKAELEDPTKGTWLQTFKILCGSGGPLETCLHELERLERKLKPPA